jgi:hypothetical protein
MSEHENHDLPAEARKEIRVSTLQANVPHIMVQLLQDEVMRLVQENNALRNEITEIRARHKAILHALVNTESSVSMEITEALLREAQEARDAG